jgi:S-adenosylmethionine synthetase
MKKRKIVSEFVSYGHPDKIADQIADAILDEYFNVDKNVRAGIEVLIKDNVVVLGGEITSFININYENVVKNVISQIPFSEEHHLNSENIKIINLIGKQSPEINKGVNKENGIIGSGDQGFMVGFANDETEDYLPLGVYLSKKICQYVSSRSDIGLGPDAKSQVIVEYNTENKANVNHILVSTMCQTDLLLVQNNIKNFILDNNIDIDNDIYEKYIKNNNDLIIDVNPNGEWHIGGPVSDCGVTGRKIVVDQFGGYSNVGGGGLSGKDFSKTDRSASYMCRYLAKNIVASKLAHTCKVELSYIIGNPLPSSINIDVDTDIDTEVIKKYINGNINLSPAGIIKRFNITEPIFYKTARYGHYGNKVYPWEKLDIADDIKNFYNQFII